MQDVGLLGVVERSLPDMPLEPLNAEMRATPLDATVRVGDESSFEYLVCIVEIEVMDNSVTEIGGKDFSFLGVFDYETGRRAWLILASE